MTARFTEKAEKIIEKTYSYASKLGHTYVGSEHLLLALLSVRDSAAAKLLESRGATLADVESTVRTVSGVGDVTAVSTDSLTPKLKSVLEVSARVAVRHRQRLIGSEHLLYALLSERGGVGVKILEILGLGIEAIIADTEAFMSDFSPFGSDKFADALDSSRQMRTQGARERESSPTLARYGTDLTARARSGELMPVIGRDTETERLITILLRKMKNNPCLIGEPGVGKTAVVEGLAQRIASGSVPESLRGRRIVSLDLPSMIVAAKYCGEFEDRMNNKLSDVKKDPDIMIFIDEIHSVVGAGAAEGSVDAASILKPPLSRGEIHVIGATTLDEYRRHIERDAALERRFQPVTVDEPTEAEAKHILAGVRRIYESHHGIAITDGAIEAAVALSARYISDRFLPDKALDLIDEAASELKVRACEPTDTLLELESELKNVSEEKEKAIRAQDFERAAKCRDGERSARKKLSAAKEARERELSLSPPRLTEHEIASRVTSLTGIPVARLTEQEGARLLALEEELSRRVVGQEEAVKAVARAVRRGRAGMKSASRPVGAFIFLGPTGVGKTELARALANSLFGSESALIRIDMSEYMEPHSTSKLIGSPPGYVGYGDGGQLTERVRRRPYSVVLFDEIEKAHPDVSNILLQILDGGILTDATGRRVNFANTVIIMTSNVGASELSRTHSLGFSGADGTDKKERARSAALEALGRSFKPEFLNRVDAAVVFDRLSHESVLKIAEIALTRISARAEELGISLSFDDDVTRLVADEGYDPERGARPVARAAARLIEDPFSEALLEGRFSSGDVVRAEARDGGVIFRKENGNL